MEQIKNSSFCGRYTDYCSRLNRDYLNDIRHRSRLTAEEEGRLALLAQQGDEAAFHRLACANLGLVVSIAKQYHWRDGELMDLVSEGNIGLLEAVQHYRTDSTARFGSYAAFWVRRRILERITPRVDYDVMALRPVSLSTPLANGDGESTLEDILPDGSADLPNRYAERRELYRRLHDAIAQLSERQQLIIALVYGFDGLGEHSLAQVASHLSLHRTVVTREHQAALKRLEGFLAQGA